jgi:hypothetical protein
MRNTADLIGGKPIAVFLQSISGVSAINPLVAFTTSMEERERCYSFILSQSPHETEMIIQSPKLNLGGLPLVIIILIRLEGVRSMILLRLTLEGRLDRGDPEHINVLTNFTFFRDSNTITLHYLHSIKQSRFPLSILLYSYG